MLFTKKYKSGSSFFTPTMSVPPSPKRAAPLPLGTAPTSAGNRAHWADLPSDVADKVMEAAYEACASLEPLRGAKAALRLRLLHRGQRDRREWLAGVFSANIFGRDRCILAFLGTSLPNPPPFELAFCKCAVEQGEPDTSALGVLGVCLFAESRKLASVAARELLVQLAREVFADFLAREAQVQGEGVARVMVDLAVGSSAA